MKNSMQQRLVVGILVISCFSFVRAAETIKRPSEKKSSDSKKEYIFLGRYRSVNMAMDVDGERLRTRKVPATRQLESTPAPVRLVAPRPKRSLLPSVSQIVANDLAINNLAPKRRLADR